MLQKDGRKGFFLKRENDKGVSMADMMINALHSPEMKLSPPDKIIYISSSSIKPLGGACFEATDNDPWFLLKLPCGQAAISLNLQIQSENSDCTCAVYFSLDRNKNFTEKNKLTLGNADGKLNEKHLVFPAPVYWLRLDPIDQAEKFTIFKFDICITDSDLPASVREEIGEIKQLSTSESLLRLNNIATEQGWENGGLVVFVTHELSGTGAPLLCRKMSSAARQIGRHTVIISLSGRNNAQVISQFDKDCDMLLICQENQDINQFVDELSKLGAVLAVLNTVVSGRVLRCFHETGFFCICLIHEMRGALKILRARGWIGNFSAYADKVVFPAQCVRDDFLSFGGDVAQKSVILPQGYYKDIVNKVDSAYKAKMKEKLGIPEGAKLIIGAGSINFRKGVDLLPLIAKELYRLGDTECHFIWLGTSTDEQYEIGLQEQIMRMRLSDKFHLMGYVADEQEYMKLFSICDVLALVSREDPYPSVMIEAMAANIPVVAFSESGGAEELLAEERGYLVDYMDIHQYALTLHRICYEPGLADGVKARAKEYIRRHGDFKEYVDQILNL